MAILLLGWELPLGHLPMDCLHCQSPRVSLLQRKTSLGYEIFRCKRCRRTFNERTATLFNFVEVPTNIIFQVLLCRVRYKLSYRDVAEFSCSVVFSSLMKLYGTGKDDSYRVLLNELEQREKGNLVRCG